MSRIENIDNWTQCPECGRKEEPGSDGLTIHQRMELGWRIGQIFCTLHSRRKDEQNAMMECIRKEFKIELGIPEERVDAIAEQVCKLCEGLTSEEVERVVMATLNAHVDEEPED